MESIIEKAVEDLRESCRRGPDFLSKETQEHLDAIFVVAAHTLQQDKIIVGLEKRISKLERKSGE